MIESTGLGLLLGLANAFSPGPLMILIVNNSLLGNKLAGSKIALSSFFADLPIIILSAFFVNAITDFPLLKIVLYFLGTILLLYYSFKALYNDPTETSTKNNFTFANAFFATFLNPHPWMFWFGVGVPFATSLKRSGGELRALSFIITFQIGFVGSNLLLALFFERLKDKFSESVITKFGKVASFLFLVLAIRLGNETLKLFPHFK